MTVSSTMPLDDAMADSTKIVLTPTEIYGTGATTITLSTGGAGDTGIFSALADGFFETNPDTRIAWVRNISRVRRFQPVPLTGQISLSLVAAGAVDIALTCARAGP